MIDTCFLCERFCRLSVSLNFRQSHIKIENKRQIIKQFLF